MRARRLTTIGLAVLAAVLAAAPAQGANLVRHASSFTPVNVEAPAAVAVDQATGDVYVAGRSGVVGKFNAAGVPDSAFLSPAVVLSEGVAVDNSCYYRKLSGSACEAADPSNGDVYVGEVGARMVVKLDSTGKEVAGFPPITASSIPSGTPGSNAFKPWGVAIDPANGNVVVADTENKEVDIFSSSGVFLSQFATPRSGAAGVAVGAGSEIFTNGPSGAQQWTPSDGYSTPTPIDSSGGFAVAVDSVTGDVLTDSRTVVREYAAPEALLLQFGAGILERSFGVAVDDATDTVYATEAESGSVYIFAAPEVLSEAITGGASGVASTMASVAGSVNPEGTSVTGCSFQYGLSASYGYTSPCSPAPPLTGKAAIPVTGSLTGLRPGETYHYRLVAVNAAGPSEGEDGTFQTPPAVPSLDDESVSALRQTSATLNASINPNDQETTYHFEYGTTTAYGTVLPVPDADIGSGYGDVVVGQQLSGLTPGTTYHYRVVATNGSSPPGGTVGPDRTFTTPSPQPPVVSTGQAQGVAQNSATLTGTIDTQGFATIYEFDIGVDTSYGTRIFSEAGSSPGAQTFAFALQGLAPGTTYHYRVAATNIFGTVYGADETFTTSTYPSSVLSEPVTTPFVPTLLLAPEPAAGAKAAGVKPAASTARHRNAKARHRNAKASSKKRPRTHRQKSGFARAGRAHDRRGK